MWGSALDQTRSQEHATVTKTADGLPGALSSCPGWTELVWSGLGSAFSLLALNFTHVCGQLRQKLVTRGDKLGHSAQFGTIHQRWCDGKVAS